MHDYRKWLLLVYVIAVIAIAAPGLSFDDPVSLFYAVLIVVVGAIPIALLCLTPYWVGAKAIGAALFGGLGLWIYVDAMLLSQLDAQAGLVFVVIPFYQAIAVAVWMLGIFLLASFQKRGA